MALHTTPSTMLKESLIETLEAAKFCSDYRKTDEKWGVYKTGGCLGYPAAILLFSIIDSIGSYFRKNVTIKILMDSQNTTIESDGWQHFKILNSKYFNQNLTSEFIFALFVKFRSFLTHNSVLGKNTMMIMDNASLNNGINGKAFFLGSTNIGEKIYMISIKELWELCEFAIDEFSKDIDIVVPNSKQGKEFH
jgi:hypothetical protein